MLLQFMISACVIACTLLMAAQMHYVSSKSLGSRENRLMVTLRSGTTVEKIDTIRNELQKNSHVLAFGTVALQSLKTARADPVEALRHVEC